jgi:hypothetical protein
MASNYDRAGLFAYVDSKVTLVTVGHLAGRDDIAVVENPWRGGLRRWKTPGEVSGIDARVAYAWRCSVMTTDRKPLRELKPGRAVS